MQGFIVAGTLQKRTTVRTGATVVHCRAAPNGSGAAQVAELPLLRVRGTEEARARREHARYTARTFGAPGEWEDR